MDLRCEDDNFDNDDNNDDDMDLRCDGRTQCQDGSDEQVSVSL